VIKNYLH